MIRIINVFIICAFLSGCATVATYGNKFEPIPEKDDTYSFKIYTGGLAGKKQARMRFDVEVSDFMLKEGYNSYELLQEKWVAIPLSGVEYIVEFKR